MVMSIAQPSTGDSPPDLKRGRLEARPALNFSDEDKVGTLQLHDDALVVTLKIKGHVKRVLVDQGSGVEIMYPYLFNGLKQRPEDLAFYNSPLIGFDRKIVFSKVQIRLSVQAGVKSCGSKLHCGRCILPLYCYCGKTLASCHGGCVFHPTLEGEVSVRGLGRGAGWKPAYG